MSGSYTGRQMSAEMTSDLQAIVEARETERSRLAQEVHDGPAQALANAIFAVEYIGKLLDRDEEAARGELRRLDARLRRDLDQVRAFIGLLRPPILEEVGLDGAIRDAGETLATLAGIPVEVEIAAPPEALDEGQQVVVLRVVQEALQNVRKHAAAHAVRVTTRLLDGWWTLEVRDDGRGFDPGDAASPARRTFGIQFMRERAELVRGRFEIRSRPADGTLVRLAIPVGGGGNG